MCLLHLLKRCQLDGAKAYKDMMYLCETIIQVARCNDVSQSDRLANQECVFQKIPIQHLQCLLH